MTRLERPRKNDLAVRIREAVILLIVSNMNMIVKDKLRYLNDN